MLDRIPANPSNDLPLPVRLSGLRRLAYNLYWTWHTDARELFKRVSPRAWARHRNPVPVLESVTDFSELLDDPKFMETYDTQMLAFDRYLAARDGHPDDDGPWFARQAGNDRKALHNPIAYFCAEFGLHESLNIYSGGLGILAGDHLKATSDLGLPLVAVGLFYRQGYFRQTIDADGHQEHAYPQLDPHHLPLQRVTDPRSGRPLLVGVELPGRTVHCAVWLVEVGRVPLLLLDTDTPENDAADRPITGQLYVRGREMRLHQEIVLGVGGVRALRALDITPSGWHLNEGHSAFMLVERIREKVVAGESFERAREEVTRDAVFTIHTPVSAGNERFDAGLVRHLGTPVAAPLDIEQLISLGRSPLNEDGIFDMTAFSLRNSVTHNGVSQLHAETANGTWNEVVPRPILGLTNGVHMPTWVGRPMTQLFIEHGADLDDLDGSGAHVWEDTDQISDEKLWEAHLRQKRRFAHFLRGRLRNQFARHGESPELLKVLGDVLDPNVLTIGFARRFATYKRAALLFRDEERLANLLTNADRPVQVVFAGKAHPADRPGQGVIQHIFERTRAERFRNHVFVLEDYDMRVGRFMVQGVDVWLNNPRRPLEASGTSGMKAAANGVLNCSILDGWWDEGCHDDNGWAIGGRETTDDEGAQDAHDGESLYQVLEQQVVPEYYDQDGGIPKRWVARMRRSIASSLWQFSSARMVEEYAERMYLPAAHSGR